MKNIVSAIFIVLLISILVLLLFTFQVRETELALKTTFGNVTSKDQITEPGVYFRWPFPIQQIHKFDSRMRVLEAEVGETTTKGAVPIIVNTYVVWKIAEPLAFFNAVETITEAESKLRSRISDTQNKVIGQHLFSEFVNSDPTKIKIKQIEDEMLADLKQSIRNDYGIEIRTLGIKQLKISKDVTEKVFARMGAARNRRTEATIAQGQAQATKIKTDADSKKTELLAAAEAMAKTIRGKGDAEAAKYYKLLEADPALAMFLRDIEALKKILAEKTTIVVSTKTAPFKLLEEMPDLKPAEPNSTEK
jgi:membrane protease subunit HflC